MKHSFMRWIALAALVCMLAAGAAFAETADLPWYLTLVNSSHAVPDDWHIEKFTELRNHQQVDSRIYPELQEMFDACRDARLKPKIVSSYRSDDDQQAILDKRYEKYRGRGYSKEDAMAEALKWVAYPGYSEHQLGLCFDVGTADESVCSKFDVWSWMKDHCAEYGFIWRYPEGKEHITGIEEEYWHFRYVGVEAATYIMEHEICLEEYLDQFYGIPIE